MHSLQNSQGKVFAFQFSQKISLKEPLNQKPPKKTKYGDQPHGTRVGGKKAQQHHTSSRQGKPSKANHKHQLLPVPRKISLEI
jgi:hypothetical protein